MSKEILDCLKRQRDICIKNILPSQNTAFMCTPALTYSGPKRSIKITDHFTCTSANAIYCITCTLCKKLYIGETGRRLGDRFRNHLRDAEKKTKTHLNRSRDTLISTIILSNIWQSAAFPYTRKQGKPQNSRTKKIFSKSAFLTLTVSTNAFHSTNLFCCFSRYHAPTNTTHNSSIRSDEGLTLETSAFEPLYCDHFT